MNCEDSKVRGVFLKLVKNLNNFFHHILFFDQNNLAEKEMLEFWKNRVFYIIAVSFLTGGTALFVMGATMFYLQGDVVYAGVEMMFYVLIVIIITRKSLSVLFRKLSVTIAVYLMSIFLLITTGIHGAGILCIFFSLILAGCLLERKYIIKIVLLNVVVFIVLTILLMLGYFDATVFNSYKPVWYINVFTSQVCGIVLIFLMNTIFSGLEKQTKMTKISEEEYRVSEFKQKRVIANISDAIVIVNKRGYVTYNSPNINKIVSWMAEEIIGKNFCEELHIENSEYICNILFQLFEEHGSKKTLEAKYRCNNGDIGFIELTAVNLIEDAYIEGMLINFHDITERKNREEEIMHLSYHDSLTGLYNRVFYEMSKNSFDTESQFPLSVITGDINGLKLINDALGHIEGDKLLVTIGKILMSVGGEDDIIARMGGDEFVILMPKTSKEVALQMVEKIYLVCDEYNQNIHSELKWISISLGAATKTSTSEAFDSIYKLAEDNMYKRKLLESRSLHSALISSMKTVLFEKSQETENHAQRLTMLTKVMGQVIGLSQQQFDELELFSTLHDIGKIGIDNQILNKPGKLTDEEWIVMKKHSEIGYRIAMVSPELMSIANYILTHHERWDGTGYPQGLSGEGIPLLSRILAVADAYDAMVEDRIYRRGMPKQVAITEILTNAGTQFDPSIAKIFVDILNNEELNEEA